MSDADLVIVILDASEEITVEDWAILESVSDLAHIVVRIVLGLIANGRSAVVSREEDQRFFAKAQLVELGDQLTDRLVEILDVVVIELGRRGARVAIAARVSTPGSHAAKTARITLSTSARDFSAAGMMGSH